MACLKDKKSNPIKASMWYTICSIIQKGIGMLLVPTYIRLMTTEEYGAYTLFQSWEGIVLIFTTLNLASYAFNNALIKNDTRKDWVTGNFLGLISTLTAVVSGIFLLFLKQWELLFGFSGKYILLMALDSSFIVIIDLWYARKRFEYQYRSVVVITLLISMANMILGILAVSLSQDKAFAAVVARVAIQGGVSICLAFSIWVKGKSFFDLGTWKYALLFNIPLIPHFLSTRILQQADRIMIQKYCGISQAGIYGFSYKISEVMLIFNSALLASVIPWTYRKLKEERYSDIFRKAFITIILIGILNLLLIMLAPEVVEILGTEKYQDAVYIIPPIACSCFLMYLFNVFVNVTYFYEQNKLVAAASVMAAVINIGLNYVFIPQYGYLAAGYTTLASYICLAIMHGVMYQYTLNIKGIDTKIYNIKKIALFAIIVILLGCGSVILYPKHIIRYVIVVWVIGVIIWKRDYILREIKIRKE